MNNLTARELLLGVILISITGFWAGWVLNQVRHNQDLKEITQQADKLETYLDWERAGKGD